MVSIYQRIIGNQGLSQVEKNVLHPYIMVCMFISQCVSLLCARRSREDGFCVGAREGRAGWGGDGENREINTIKMTESLIYVEDNMKYPDFEKSLDGQIDALMEDWSKVSDDYFTTDGFYPYYTTQRYRILVVARESRGLSGCDYIPILHDAYKQNRIGDHNINKDMFHRRTFFLIYGLLNGFPEWSDVPYPDQMTPTFATPDGISFAFMNISKISNESPNYQANWANIHKSMTDATSGDRNFIREEVTLLAPDVIIGSGVDDLFRVLGDGELLSSGALMNSYLLRISDKPVLFFSYKYHFTATKGAGNMGLEDYQGFYLPIKEAFLKYLHVLGER